jgi:hypothetical protein
VQIDSRQPWLASGWFGYQVNTSNVHISKKEMVEYRNIRWFLHNGVLLPMVPPHVEFDLNRADQHYLLKKTRARLIRWTNQFDKENSKFWYIIKDSFAGFEELSAKTRNQVRRGFRNFIAEPTSFGQLKQQGYQTYLNAFKSYTTFEKPMSEADFVEHISWLESSELYEVWGVWDRVKNYLAGFSENLILGNTCFYEKIYSDPGYLKNYSSYALFYEMNKYYLQEKKFKYVHDGSRSLSHDTNVQEFLVGKFKFRKAFCKLNIAYRFDVLLLAMLFYPFRASIYRRDDSIGRMLAVLLRHEEIRRAAV